MTCEAVQCEHDVHGTSPFFTVHWHDLWTCLNLAMFLLCSHDIKQLAWRKHVYHVTPGPASGKSWVAKVVATPYPRQLHEELSTLGLAPKLVTPVDGYPGGVQVIKMEYLDPTDGWVRLERFIGDWDAVQEVAMEALKSLQSCLDGQAVHGDLNPGSLLVRYAMGTGSAFGLSCTGVCPSTHIHGTYRLHVTCKALASQAVCTWLQLLTSWHMSATLSCFCM